MGSEPVISRVEPESAGPSRGDLPFNYRYLIRLAAQIGGRVLDYGCGNGIAVAHGLCEGLDIWGADTYQGFYADWRSVILPAAKDRICELADGAGPYPDGSFDCIICNQVLEHVRDPLPPIRDIHRLLSPGGVFIACFPVWECWYEGHVGLYFAHRLARVPRLRHAYLTFCHGLGLGLYRDGLDRRQWVAQLENVLDEVCFYHRGWMLTQAIESIFGAPATDLAAEYMRARLGIRSRRLSSATDRALVLIFRIRAGRIFSVRKPDA